ncbi:MAG: hypothetical protein JOY58_13160 [Solirubrobacterales bacterium]|nr:hypothetical protein [Solirubrobacterales bacterium]
MAPLWRQAFDAVERPIAAAAESWVQTDTFMDLTAFAFKIQRRVLAEGHRASEQWLHTWGMSSQADLAKLMNQIGSLERELRDLRRELERREAWPQVARVRNRKAA